MHTISEPEARALLAKPLTCPDLDDWRPVREQRGCSVIDGGLIDENGVSTGLYVSLQFQRSISTGLCKYVFTVFKLEPGGAQRVYQLEVKQHPKPPKDLHAWSHEHIGTTRKTGDAEWQKWDYSDVLSYFCDQTNIKFVPPLRHPEAFELKP
jgi:hypothetical protein